jgi:hypothetical protein
VLRFVDAEEVLWWLEPYWVDTITVFSGDSERGKGDKIRLNHQGHAFPLAELRVT